MPKYRIFTIGSDGHFPGVPKIAEFADDKEVVEKAMRTANGADSGVDRPGVGPSRPIAAGFDGRSCFRSLEKPSVSPRKILRSCLDDPYWLAFPH
jgi:hypothetical protein